MAGMPSAIRLSTIPPTTSRAEKMFGAPEQFTLMPTTSVASKKLCPGIPLGLGAGERAHAARQHLADGGASTL